MTFGTNTSKAIAIKAGGFNEIIGTRTIAELTNALKKNVVIVSPTNAP